MKTKCLNGSLSGRVKHDSLQPAAWPAPDFENLRYVASNANQVLFSHRRPRNPNGRGYMAVGTWPWVHPNFPSGRLDLLLQEAESSRRYEVEIQLGATDESHIIRTIEYWDIERKRYPQYEHAAVIVAEDITSRFLNVINLFNGMIPLIAIQMNAIKMGDKVGLVFTTVLDQVSLGLVDEDEETQEVTDRAYWESRGSKKTLAMADELLALAKDFDRDLELKYNKFYIGLAKDGQPRNFVIVRPTKEFIRFEPRLKNSNETTERLEKTGLDVMDYDSRWGRYRIRLKPGEIDKQKGVLSEVVKEAFGAAGD